MCNSNCDCNRMEERVDAVKRRIETMIGDSVTAIEEKISGMQVDVDAQVADINKTLFDGIAKDITGDELKELLCVGDLLSFDNLLEREDVQVALKATQDIQVKAFDNAIGIGGKVHSAETAIDDYAQKLWDDVLIAGMVPANMTFKLKKLERVIAEAINSI